MKRAEQLYPPVVLQHSRNPFNRGPLAEPDGECTATNPLCGDKVTVRVHIKACRIDTVKFEARGCAITIASASLMTLATQGLSVDEAERLGEVMRNLAKRDPSTATSDTANEGLLALFAGVRIFPSRRRCATLPWEALAASLNRQ